MRPSPLRSATPRPFYDRVLLSLLAGWLGCNQVAGIKDGKPFPDACMTAADCDPGACRAATCEDKRCVYTEAPSRIPEDDDPCTDDVCLGVVPMNKPRSWAPCYTGSPLTKGVGLCHEGKQACEEGKPTGPCLGEVAPATEACGGAVHFDEDCDGEVDEAGCSCAPGAVAACYPASPSTLGIGPCAAGTQVCNAEGTGYWLCNGAQVPALETCDAERVDEDCDGEKNEEGPDCVCGDGYVSNAEACDDPADADMATCTNTCRVPGCGDGVVDPKKEQCDDGNFDDNDACLSTCKWNVCGDGVLYFGGEACDDGASNPVTGCECAFAVELAVGAYHNCARFSNGAVKCWGYGSSGKLGLGDENDRGDAALEMGENLPALDFGPGKTAKRIAAGDDHNCAILSDDTLACWGLNDVGQLGLGHTSSIGDNENEMGKDLPLLDLGPGNTAMALSLSVRTTCVLMNGGSVRCWGDNAYGQLGAGNKNNRGDEATETVDSLPNLPLGFAAEALAGGLGSHCALSQESKLAKCWGNNADGQLGVEMAGDFGDDMGEILPFVVLGMNKTVAAFPAQSLGIHRCMILSPGSGSGVKCWGNNTLGQLGLGDMMRRGIDAGEMGDLLPWVDLGDGKQAKALAIGAEHTCAALTDGSVKCWGNNDRGQLGLGDTAKRGIDASQMGNNLKPVDLGEGKQVASIGAGVAHTCALLTDGTIKCWGDNTFSQLGLGDMQPRGDEPSDMGSNLPPVDLW